MTATKITEIETFCVPPRWIFVRLTTQDGHMGWGEAIVPRRRHAVLGAIKDLTAVVVGQDARRIEELWQRMRRSGFFRGGPVLATATAAIEQALWDLAGKRLGVPVHEMLGGRVRERIPVYAWIGGDRPRDLVADAQVRLEQGFRVVKLNATEEVDYIASNSDVDQVVERIGALRDAFGSRLDIAVDFHGRVHRPMARTLLAELAQFRLLWIEEPLSPGHEDHLVELSRASGGQVRLATGERLTSRWDFRKLLTLGGVDILQPDVSLTGLFELEKICRMAEAFDVAVVPHCPNGPISLAASLQVASACLNVPLHEQSIGLHYHRDATGATLAEPGDYLVDATPLTPVDGHVPVPEAPGLGLTLDTASVQARETEWQVADPHWRHADGRIAEW